MELPEPVEKELWARVAAEGDANARERLFRAYMPWAAAIARGVHRRVRAYPADCDDFVQNATMGLMEAMTRYQPDRGIPFPAYARPRVRGAVFNGLRVILGDRLTSGDEARFAVRLESIQGQATESAFDSVVDSIIGLGMAFLLDDAAQATVWQQQSDALEYVQRSETQARLVAAVGQLPDRLKTLIQKHYFQFITFHDIAMEWGVTKGRVSQLHKSALDRLRELLRDA
jgi:RNA polymerase sigma factor for flagellar operon FliA